MENHYNCIYMYVNKVNGKRYVGQAVDFNDRHREHIRKHKQVIDRAIDKYGEENFEIIILKENLSNQCLLNFWECYYIDKYNCLAKNGNGYNISDGGHNGNAFAGKTEEEMLKIRRKNIEGQKKHWNNMSEEDKKWFADKHKKENLSSETRQKMRDAQKGKTAWNKGKQMSEEQKEKMKKPKSEEHKRKLSQAKTGKPSYNSKLIDRYDLEENYIDTHYQFEFIKMGFSQSNLYYCLKGKQKSHKGFIFKYHETE